MVSGLICIYRRAGLRGLFGGLDHNLFRDSNGLASNGFLASDGYGKYLFSALGLGSTRFVDFNFALDALQAAMVF